MRIKTVFDQARIVLEKEEKQVSGGTIVDAAIMEAPNFTKNPKRQRDPEMRSVKKRTKWCFGMRIYIDVDPLHRFVHAFIGTCLLGFLRRNTDGRAGLTAPVPAARFPTFR